MDNNKEQDCKYCGTLDTLHQYDCVDKVWWCTNCGTVLDDDESCEDVLTKAK